MRLVSGFGVKRFVQLFKRWFSFTIFHSIILCLPYNRGVEGVGSPDDGLCYTAVESGGPATGKLLSWTSIEFGFDRPLRLPPIACFKLAFELCPGTDVSNFEFDSPKLIPLFPPR